jgi:hypothetical protein
MIQENLLAENAELKRKLAEAEVLVQRICREAGAVLFGDGEVRNHRAEAAERERDEWKRRAGEASDYGASMLSAAMARTDERDEARRKCAELSEALRAWADELRAYVPHDKENGTAILVAKIEGIAALASQPAPEAKPVPLVLYCPAGHLHVDEGEWATRPHKTHQCQRPKDCGCGMGSRCERLSLCGLEWRPADFPTVGVKPTPEAP